MVYNLLKQASLLFIFLCINISAVTAKSVEEKKHPHKQNQKVTLKQNEKVKNSTPTNNKTQPSNKESLENVLKVYEGLHASFFNYDGKKVEEAAKKLDTAIEQIKDTKVKDLLKLSQEKLKAIKASESRENNNNHLHTVSMALIYVMDTYDVSDNYAPFTCPMVKKKWISKCQKHAKSTQPLCT